MSFVSRHPNSISPNLNVILSILLALVCLLLFVALQVAAVVLPLLLGLFLFQTAKGIFSYIDTTFPFYFYSLLVGGFFISTLTLINLARSLEYAISEPVSDTSTEDPRILSLVREVEKDVGVSRFKAIYLNSDLDISTFYIGRGRYLNLSVLALKYLTVEEIRAVIAHECAHHHHNAMLLNRVYYRTFLFYSNFENALLETFSSFQELVNRNFIYEMLLSNWGGVTLFPLLLSIKIYRQFLEFVGTLVRDAEYEYYCDSVAANYVGGNILASALQKVFYFHIAYHRFHDKRTGIAAGKTIINNIERTYLIELDQEFLHIRFSKEIELTKMASRKTDTHPPLTLRMERAQAFDSKVDNAESLFSDGEIELQLAKLPGSPFIEAARQALETSRQRSLRLDAIKKAQCSEGKVLLILKRKREFIAFCSKYQVLINHKFVGTIGISGRAIFDLDPGLNILCIKAGEFKSEDLELIFPGGEDVKVECWGTYRGNLYVSLKK